MSAGKKGCAPPCRSSKDSSCNLTALAAQLRDLWRYYYQGSHALVYTVDSADCERLKSVGETLHYLLGQDELRGIPVLVLANKQDLPTAVPVTELAEKLGLHKIREHMWFIQTCCAVTGDGLYEGFDWLAGAVRRNRRSQLEAQ